MNSNLSNIGGNNALAKPPSNALVSANPYSPTGNSNNSNDWQQNSWYSANPLVMNHQLPPPSTANMSTTASTTPNNNFSSLNDLDPFEGNKQSQKKTTHV